MKHFFRTRRGQNRVLRASSLIAPLLHPYNHLNNYGSGYKETITLEQRQRPYEHANKSQEPIDEDFPEEILQEK